MKKFTKALSVVLALVLLACCASAVGYAESETDYYEAILLPEMDLSITDWFSTKESRALYAALMTLEMYAVDDLGFSETIETYGIPTMYLTQYTSFEGEDIAMIMNFTEGNFQINVTYVGSLGVFFVGRTEADFTSVTPEQYMSAYKEGTLIGEYYEIGLTEYANAINQISEILGE